MKWLKALGLFMLFFWLYTLVAVSANLIGLLILFLAGDGVVDFALLTAVAICYAYFMLSAFSKLFDSLGGRFNINHNARSKRTEYAYWIVFSILLPILVVTLIYIASKGAILTIGAVPESHVLIMTFISALFPGIVEELCYRWFLYRKLKEHTNKIIGMILSGMVFGMLHFNQVEYVNDMFLLLISALAVSFLFCTIYELTGSIVPCIIVHVAWDFFTDERIFNRVNNIIDTNQHSESMVTLYYPDTNAIIAGGEFGIETSIVTMMTYAVFAVIFWRGASKTAYR